MSPLKVKPRISEIACVWKTCFQIRNSIANPEKIAKVPHYGIGFVFQALYPCHTDYGQVFINPGFHIKNFSGLIKNERMVSSTGKSSSVMEAGVPN